jgi:hypothetical protein
MVDALCPYTVPATKAKKIAKDTALRMCTPLTRYFELSEATYRPLTVARSADSVARLAMRVLDRGQCRARQAHFQIPAPARTYAPHLKYTHSKYRIPLCFPTSDRYSPL